MEYRIFTLLYDFIAYFTVQWKICDILYVFLFYLLKEQVMYSRLKKELNDFLITYSISADSFIFENMLIQFAGIEANKGRYRFDNYNKSDLILSIPSISLVDLDKLLNYFKISHEDYRTNEGLHIHEKVMFDDILPAFKAHIMKLAEQAEQAPNELKKYQIDSKSKLEADAIRNMTRLSTRLLDLLNDSGNVDGLDANKKQLSEILFQILGTLNVVSEKVKYYKYIFEFSEKLGHFCASNLDISTDAKYSSDLFNLFKEFQTYFKFNRAESALAIKKIFTELQEFALKYQISTTESDIFEETLLSMAGVTNKPQECKFKRGYDQTRMEFSIKGISQEDAKMFLEFIHAHGDETAQIDTNHFYLNNSRHILHSAVIGSDEEVPQRAFIGSKPAKAIERYTISVDGQSLYEKILPLFKSRIEELAQTNPAYLIPYQEKSKEFVSTLEAKNKSQVQDKAEKNDAAAQVVNTSSLFYHPSTAMDEQSTIPVYRDRIGNGM